MTTYDVITPIGTVAFTADDWLTGPVNPTAVLDFLPYELRPPERADTACSLVCWRPHRLHFTVSLEKLKNSKQINQHFVAVGFFCHQTPHKGKERPLNDSSGCYVSYHQREFGQHVKPHMEHSRLPGPRGERRRLPGQTQLVVVVVAAALVVAAAVVVTGDVHGSNSSISSN
ncbi:hypothetical protein ElyMa_000519900 [Elysia marginata]|uniref:Uncharacterized protein n=1 Tax=Elysia marginata TaxID=1093978 RepID=A0AAV4G006_9GAST|nr:hypothetical protein ElyMa_000519900 [Elysia marginata]